MLIRFAKHANRPPTLNCVRDDGTASWYTASPANAEFFVAHDLLHYVVETTLGYTSAFYGLVDAGRDLNDFGSRDGASDDRSYTSEAKDAERLVGFIQVMAATGDPPSLNMVTDAWNSSAKEHDSSAPPLSEEQLTEICTRWRDLVGQWHAVESAGTLELAFPKPLA